MTRRSGSLCFASGTWGPADGRFGCNRALGGRAAAVCRHLTPQAAAVHARRAEVFLGGGGRASRRFLKVLLYFDLGHDEALQLGLGLVVPVAHLQLLLQGCVSVCEGFFAVLNSKAQELGQLAELLQKELLVKALLLLHVSALLKLGNLGLTLGFQLLHAGGGLVCLLGGALEGGVEFLHQVGRHAEVRVLLAEGHAGLAQLGVALEQLLDLGFKGGVGCQHLR
eukprot:scaffold165968_cov39-Prasinocladus_malaysianus.AAC.2